MNDGLILIFGIVCAGFGGELFVRGLVGLAGWLRISQAVIGATVAAFATSSPELSVAVNAAVAGSPQIAMGDALGSNVVNVALILAVTALIGGIHSSRDSLRRDLPMAMLVPLATWMFAVDSVLSRTEGLLMLAMFLGWGIAKTIEAGRQRRVTAAASAEREQRWILAACLGGMALLIVAGVFIVQGARGLAMALGMDEFIIGATIVAIGTSTPELATTIVAGIRGHSDISLGTILGSNIFNGLLIVAVAAIIQPIAITGQEVTIALFFGIVALALAVPGRNGCITRHRGGLLLAVYVAYLAVLLRHLAN